MMFLFMCFDCLNMHGGWGGGALAAGPYRGYFRALSTIINNHKKFTYT